MMTPAAYAATWTPDSDPDGLTGMPSVAPDIHDRRSQCRRLIISSTASLAAVGSREMRQQCCDRAACTRLSERPQAIAHRKLPEVEALTERAAHGCEMMPGWVSG